MLWNAVSKATIVNCFKKANNSSSNQVVAKNDTDDPFKCFVEELNSSQMVNLNVVKEDLPEDSSVGLDNDIVKSGSIISEADFIFDISNDVNSNADNDDSNPDVDIDKTQPLRLSNVKVEEALNKFHNLSFFNTYS